MRPMPTPTGELTRREPVAGLEPGNPLPTLFLFIAAYLYVNGLGKWERPSHPVNVWQKISFFAGLFVIS